MTTCNARPTRPELSASLTVNALIVWYPSALPVLNRFGIDTCCGGAESLGLAARSANIPFEELMAGISAVVERTASERSVGSELSPAAVANR